MFQLKSVVPLATAALRSVEATGRKLAVGALALLAVAGLTVSGASVASADPIGSPIPRDINLVGSDTSQDLLNGIANNAMGDAGLYIGSYDAGVGDWTALGLTGATPNGSGAGVTALSKALQNQTWTNNSGAQTVAGKIHSARSSSRPSTKFEGGTDLTFVPLARDAVTVAASPLRAKPLPGNVPFLDTDIDTSDYADNTLSYQKIFKANSSLTLKHDGVTYTVGNQASGADIVPFIPQLNSGTRDFFSKAVGGFGSLAADTFTITGQPPVQVQEHNGRVTKVVANAVVPFSAAQWIAQGNVTGKPGSTTSQDNVQGTLAGIPVKDRRYDAIALSVGGSNPIVSGIQNVSFDDRLTRNVYTVISTSAIGDSSNTENKLLNKAFVGGGAQACTVKLGVASVIELFGFSRTLAKEFADDKVTKITPTCGQTDLATLKSGYYS